VVAPRRIKTSLFVCVPFVRSARSFGLEARDVT
jgi:hypothetical protein